MLKDAVRIKSDRDPGDGAPGTFYLSSAERKSGAEAPLSCLAYKFSHPGRAWSRGSAPVRVVAAEVSAAIGEVVAVVARVPLVAG